MPKHALEAPEFTIPQLVPDEEPVPAYDPYESTNIGVRGFGAKPAEAPKPRPERSTLYPHGKARRSEIEEFTELARQAELAREAQVTQTALGHRAVGQVVPPAPRVFEQVMPQYRPSHTFYPDQPDQ